MSRSGMIRGVFLPSGVCVMILGVVQLSTAGGLPLGILMAVVQLAVGAILATIGVVGERPGEPARPRAGDPPGGGPPGSQNALRSGLAPARSDRTAPPVPAGRSPTGDLGEMAASFNRWLTEAGEESDLWPSFDRWLRDALNGCFEGRRVRCFRIESDGGKLTPLTELEDVRWTGASSLALLEHLISVGRNYVRGSRGQGELIEQLAEDWRQTYEDEQPTGRVPPPADWVVTIRDRQRSIGVVIVSELGAESLSDTSLLAAAGHLIEVYWLHVRQARALKIAECIDRTSGVLSRQDFVRRGSVVVVESARESEPAVAIALAVEGVRRLDDQGAWDLRDWLMQGVGGAMSSKLRSDDLVGRFSDDRFVAIARRVNLPLAELISKKLLEAVREELASEPMVAESIRVRCGLAEAAGAPFDVLIDQAFDALQDARAQDKDIVVQAGPAEPAACGGGSVAHEG